MLARILAAVIFFLPCMALGQIVPLVQPYTDSSNRIANTKFVQGAIAVARPAPGPAGQVMATPTGFSGYPSLRYLEGSDLPSPSSLTLGGVESFDPIAASILDGISTLGVPHSIGLGSVVSSLCGGSTVNFVRGDGTCQPAGGGGGTGTVTSVGLGVGLTTTIGTCNDGTQAITVSGTITPQDCATVFTANQAVPDSAGSRSYVANGSGSITFTLVQATSANKGQYYCFSDESAHGYTLASTTSTFYGMPGISGVSNAFPASSGVCATSDGTNWNVLGVFGNYVQVSGTLTNGNGVKANASGLLVDAGTYPVGANPSATASNTAVNGSAATYMRSDGAPAIQKASSAQFGLAECDNTTITCSGGVLTAIGTGNSLQDIFISMTGLTQATTKYYAGASNSGVAANVAVPIASGATFANLRVSMTTAPASGQNAAFTLFTGSTPAGMGASTLTCTVTNPATTCSDLVHTVSVTAGTTVWAMQVITSATSGTLQPGVSFTLQ